MEENNNINSSKYKKIIIAVAILSFLAFCIILGSYMLDIELSLEDLFKIKYAGDGKHVCVILQHLRDGSDVNADYDLYYATTGLKEPRYISDGIQDVQVSPSGRYVLFYNEKSNYLTVLDTKTFREIHKIKNANLLNYGWYPNEMKIWYKTSNKGVFLRDLKTDDEKFIGKGSINEIESGWQGSFAWSKNGRYFASVYGFNELSLFDIKNNIEEMLFETDTVAMVTENMVFNNGDIVSSISAELDGSGEINRYSSKTKAWTNLWRLKPASPDASSGSGVNIRNFELNKPGTKLLFGVISQDNYDSITGIYQLDLATNKAIRLIPVVEPELWDYNPETNKIIWFDYDKKKLKEKQLN